MNKQQGFTLVEVLVAVVILTGTILGLIQTMATNLTTSRDLERLATCTLLAEEEMERLKGLLFHDYDTDITALSEDLGQGYWVTRTVGVLTTDQKQIGLEVGYDTNGNDDLDASEVQVTLNTAYANTN